jgi:hypothetical protein
MHRNTTSPVDRVKWRECADWIEFEEAILSFATLPRLHPFSARATGSEVRQTNRKWPQK